MTLLPRLRFVWLNSFLLVTLQYAPVKERSFLSCFFLIASLLAFAWRGRQSGRPTTIVRMPTLTTSDAWEDRNWYATLSNATFSLRLWYQLPHPLWGRDESDESSARAWAGRCFTSRYGLMTSWRFLPSWNELAVTSVYWALFTRSGEPCFGLIVCWVLASMQSGPISTGNTQSTGFYGGTRNLDKQKHRESVDHQKQRLEFTPNLLRFAQAHLSLKLLRFKKSFDLTCSRVVSVHWIWVFLWIYLCLKWLWFNPHSDFMVEWSSR